MEEGGLPQGPHVQQSQEDGVVTGRQHWDASGLPLRAPAQAPETQKRHPAALA